MRPHLLVAATLAGLLLPAAPAVAADPIMPLSEVRSGMRCTGLSVIRGTDISSFAVEVVDVVDGEPGTDGPRILVEVSGPAVDATGIGPGFSGSPILCPDAAGVRRNIGAISESVGAFGGKLVLATPIEAMLANPVEAPRGAGPRSAKAAAAIRRLRAEGSRPLVAPLTISGLSQPLGRALEQAGARIGRPVLAVPAGPLGGFPPQQLRPGSAVSVGYSSGDVRLGAVGTVSYVDGPSVWALGHPFEGAGARSLLLQDAYVFRVVNEPNAAITGGSYKYAVAGHDLGTLTNDAFSTVVGRVGALPPTTAVLAIGRDGDTGEERILNTTVADETDLDNPTGFSPLGSVAPLAVAQAAGSVLRSSPGRLTGRMCLRITFRERPRKPARFCNRYLSSALFEPSAGPLGNPVAFSAGSDVFEAISLVETFEGRTPHITRVRAAVEVQRGERLALLRRIRAPRRVRAGRTVRLRVTVQRVRGGRVTRTERVRIPRSIRPGRRTLRFTGASAQSPDEQLIEILLGDEDGGGGREGPTTLAGLTQSIEELERWDGVRMRVGGMRRRAFRDDDLIIAGSAEVPIRVERRP